MWSLLAVWSWMWGMFSLESGTTAAGLPHHWVTGIRDTGVLNSSDTHLRATIVVSYITLQVVWWAFKCNIVLSRQLLKRFKEFLTVSLGPNFFTIKQRECYSHSP